jgi:hypothetical protein
MDRLLRLLPKMHSAFDAFCGDFSRAIFLCDKDDEANVRRVLKAKGIDWEYARHAKSYVLNRRIRRLIPAPDIIVPRLQLLFDGYKNLVCSNKPEGQPGQTFFSKDAHEMAARLLSTAKLGFLSDPVGFSLYYRMGIDKDGLTIYRTIRGTNSVEGGVHMTIRRVFGSLQASPELAECILMNWILRRNCSVCSHSLATQTTTQLLGQIGHHNRTGKKYHSHFDLWLRDEITELSGEVGIQTSFVPPHVLSTRIATSETFGIIPLSTKLAEDWKITVLPIRRVTGMPHYRDVPVHTLTHLETRPKTRLCSLQLRQRSLYPITPVHTHAEFIKFKEHVLDPLFRRNVRKAYSPNQSNRNIDFDEFARFWNSEVEKQDRAETDSSKRIYYKVPSQLEKHYKKTVAWRATRSTVMTGSNATALEPLRELLAKPNTTSVLHARSLPDHCYSEQGKHTTHFLIQSESDLELCNHRTFFTRG